MSFAGYSFLQADKAVNISVIVAKTKINLFSLLLS